MARAAHTARLLERRQRGEGEVVRVELVRRREQLRLAPDDGLLSEPEEERPFEHVDVEVGLLQLLRLGLAGAAVPRELLLAEVLLEGITAAVAQVARVGQARVEETLGLIDRAGSGGEIRRRPVRQRR
jgi:hypothetical protein